MISRSHMFKDKALAMRLSNNTMIVCKISSESEDILYLEQACICNADDMVAFLDRGVVQLALKVGDMAVNKRNIYDIFVWKHHLPYLGLKENKKVSGTGKKTKRKK